MATKVPKMNEIYWLVKPLIALATEEIKGTQQHSNITRKLEFMEANYVALVKVHWGLKVVISEEDTEPKGK